ERINELGLLTVIVFILILSLLIFVHELGHFVVAKRSGITVEEFAIGFPPRAIKLWQEEGQITLDGQEYVISRTLNVPRAIQPGAQVYAETTIDEQGRRVVAKLEPVEAEEHEKPQAKQKAGSEARLFGLLAPKPKATPPQPEGRPTITVDALTRPTEYALNWIPFGGYVRMVGEEDPSAPGSFASKSKKVRFAVLVAGSVMNLITAVVFFTFTAMSGVPEPVTGINAAGDRALPARTVVSEVLADMPAAKAGLQAGDIILGAGDTAFAYTGDFDYYIENHLGQEIMLQLEREGQTRTATLTPQPEAAAAAAPGESASVGIKYEEAPLAKTVITEVVADTPAAKAGIQVNDVVLGADGQDFKYAGELVAYVEKTKGTAITLRLERNGELVTASLVPRANPPAGEGAMGVGIRHDFDSQITYYPLHEAVVKGPAQTIQYVGLTFYAPIAVLRNIFPAEAARPTGPVGIYQQTDSAVEAAVSLNWWFPVLWLTSVLSTALAVTNLLPLPALDGGRIMFIIIEAIRGKRISPEKEGAIHFVGLALLLTLMLVISYYDLSKPIPTIDWGSFF
ncbi:MAG: site-2 protease family protein, partial [Chloroflexota bacterium]